MFRGRTGEAQFSFAITMVAASRLDHNMPCHPCAEVAVGGGDILLQPIPLSAWAQLEAYELNKFYGRSDVESLQTLHILDI